MRKETRSMSEEYGSDFLTVVDDEGQEYELEHILTLELDGKMYMAFLPADMDEDDEDYGTVLLQVVEENGEDVLISIDDEDEEQRVYDEYMRLLFADEDEDAPEE